MKNLDPAAWVFFGTVFTAIAAFVTTWFKKPGANKANEPISKSDTFENLSSGVEIDMILKDLVHSIDDIVVCSVGAVTNHAMPANLQIIYSSDHDTFQVWSAKQPMEFELRKVHVQMMLKGDEQYDPSQMKKEATQHWFKQMKIKRCFVFNIGVTNCYVSGTNEECHLVLYVNLKCNDIQSADFYNRCRISAGEIRERIDKQTGLVTRSNIK